MNRKLISILGAPGVGKSTLAMDLNSYFLKSGNSSTYVTEWVKDFANRKWHLDVIDQFSVFGGQTQALNSAILGEYSIITSCSSPLLCSFYANYYGNNNFLALKEAALQWSDYIEDKFNISVYYYFLSLSEEEYARRYQSTGRYESLKDSLTLQNKMLEYFSWCGIRNLTNHITDLDYDLDLQYIIEDIKNFEEL